MIQHPHNIFKNWEKYCYIMPKLDPIEDIYGNEIPQYGNPIKFKFNYQPVTDKAELMAFGVTNKGMVKALVDICYLKNLI